MKKNCKSGIDHRWYVLKRALFAMKLTTLIFLISTLSLMAGGSYSQNTRISLNMKNAAIKDVLLKIENSSEFFFVYNNQLVDVDRTVSINVNDKKISDILVDLFTGQQVDFQVADRKIVIAPTAVASSQASEKVTGKVTDSGGSPLPGVSVVVKGTTNGTISNTDGTYSIPNVSGNAVLTFSFVGMKTQDVAVAGKSVINVKLEEETVGIDEVVAIGYGVTKKNDLTGSVSSISSDDFEKQPTIRIEDALKGKVSGVQIQKPNGAPGSGMRIRIRGTNSINGDNNPLYVIDGSIGADILSINPNEIASINILKDASSTAIYGSRGANGVVLITTKTAKAGDSKIQFDAFYSLDQISKKYDLMSGDQYMTSINERLAAVDVAPLFTASEIAAVKASGGTDWQDEIFNNGGTQNYQLSFSGGTEKTQYYLSGNVADQKGIMINSDYKRYGLRTNINSKLKENFNLVFTMYSTYEEYRNNYDQSGRNNPAGTALIFPPNLPIMDPVTGDYTVTPSYGPVAGNPVFGATETNFDHHRFQTLSTLQLNYEIVKGLTFSVLGSAKGIMYDNPYFKHAAPGTNVSNSEAGHDNGFGWNLQNTNMLNYNKIFADKHNLNVTAIYEQQMNISRTNSDWATGFPTISLGYDNLSLGVTQKAYSGYENWAIQSYVGRLNYTYNSRYLFTGTFRADGSSKFNGDNKYSYFPSAALGWRMSEEPFIQSLNAFQNLKFRASYGVTGSQAILPYKTLSLLSLGQNYSYNGSTPQAIGIGPGMAANPDLKWETTAQTNIGFDFGILKGRISGTIDYYYKKTTDLLMDVNVPNYSGGGTITQNIGSLQNKGFEYLISGVLIDKSDLKLNTSLNMSFNRNKILSLGDKTEIFSHGGWSTNTDPWFILKVGKPLGEFRGLVSQGLWQTNEAAEAALYGKKPGDSKYMDVDGNHSIGGEDMVDLGSSQPDFIWGWNTSLEYKNFDLTLYVNGVQGNKVWNMNHWFLIAAGSDVKYPLGLETLNHWTPTNTNTTIAAYSATAGTLGQTSQFLEDGSFIRLSNVTLGYTFPKRIIGNKFSDARIYVSGQNLLLITKYSGTDPEITVTPGWTDISQGIDFGAYPATRTITVGIKVAF